MFPHRSSRDTRPLVSFSRRLLALLCVAGLAGASPGQTLFVPSGTSGIGSSVNSSIGIGTSSPTNRLSLRTDGSSAALRISGSPSAPASAGLFISSIDEYSGAGAGENEAVISVGASFAYAGGQASSWTAGDTSFGAFHIDNGSLYYYANTGLTIGNTFTPTARLFIGASGNVGIGTQSPVRLLHVVDTFNDTQLRLGGGTRDIAIESSTGAGIGQIVSVANVSGQSRFQFGDATMTLRGGKVGVGIAAPVGVIDIWNYYSSGVDSLRFSYNDGLDYWMGIQPYVVGDGNVGYKFRTNNITTTTDALAISGDGKVGIGTTLPAAALHIKRGDPGVLSPYYGYQVRIDSNLNAGLLLSSPLAKDAYVYHNTPLDGASAGFKFSGTGRYIAFFTVNGTERMRIDNVGNVGIGTTSPSHKLAVNGTIRAKEVIVDTGWADHVFAADYRLAPLSEVEQHIQQRGHLPDVPSAADVAARGVSVGEMQKILLQKIEELTLHVIAQKKQLDAQQAEITRLRKGNQTSDSR